MGSLRSPDNRGKVNAQRHPEPLSRKESAPLPGYLWSTYTLSMKNLGKVAKTILKRVEESTGKSIQFLRDEKLSVLSTLQMARHGAEFHVLRYKPTDEPLDYIVAFQAGFVLRLFENEPDRRFDFSPNANAQKQVEVLVAAGQALSPQDSKAMPSFSKLIAQWSLMNLRSLPIGMRIDRWISTEYPELKELQKSGIATQQQQNMDVLGHRLGKLIVPTPLLGPNAAYALFADRLLGSESFSVPYEAMGLLAHGKELMGIWDSTPANATGDCHLVDQWANACGMACWYDWLPYNA